MAEKPHLNLVFIGHVDHGKSTTVGRLLFEMGAIGEHIIRQYREEAQKIGKATFEFAWVMDRLKEERERGLTIDISHQKMETDKYYFTIIDALGHRDFIKNMITGASQADAAVLVVDVAQKDEKGGLMPQTKEHVFLARTLGIGQFIVAINKMDAVDWSKEKFEETKAQLDKLFKIVGYKPEQITYVPISALQGENIVKKSDKMPWWDGPTLVEALNNLKVPEKPIDLPLRIPIQDVYSITGIGTVPVGRVETGVLKPGDKVIFEPPGVTGEVKSIEMHHEPIEKADYFAFSISTTMPAATVIPISRIANLPSWGISLTFSTTRGLVGCTRITPASPVFRNCGFFSSTLPVRGSSLLMSSTILHATCAVWAWNTGV